MASNTSDITLEQLASVDAKLLFKALEMRLASAGVIKKRGSKKMVAAKTSSAADDAASEASSGRSVGEGTKAHNDQTKIVASLVKEALAGEKGKAGFHLKVQSVLRSEMGLTATSAPSLDQVRDAITFLKSNPEWTSPNQKAKASKSKPEDASSSSTSAASSSSSAAVVAEQPKKKGRPAKSAEEKEAEKAAKKAEKDAAKTAKAAEKPKKAAKKAEKPATKVPEPVAEDDEESSSELVGIELNGVDYIWDQESGAVFENIDGHPGDRIGTWDGASDSITTDE
jgi:hypothetical protein